MTDYPITRTEDREYGHGKRRYFECDCGRELVAQRTECKYCGAHYYIEDGVVGQLAPPQWDVDDEEGDDD